MAFVALEFNEEEYELPARDGRLDAASRNALQLVSPLFTRLFKTSVNFS